MNKRVGIVDDSVIARTVLEEIINEAPGFEVAGKAGDPYEAREMLFDKKPDILTLDVEMPKLDGISFLKSLMSNYPIPVVMVSSLTDRTSRKGERALELGAVDVVCKPAGDSRDSLRSLKDELLPKLEAAARANVQPLEKKPKKKRKKEVSISLPTNIEAIVIGSSTGGTKALRQVFEEMPTGLPPILICQHMPRLFTAHFAEGLNEITDLQVYEAEDGQKIKKNEVGLAPGDYHMVVSGVDSSTGLPVSLNQDEEVNFQRPAVDPLFESATKKLKKKVLGIVLTGMGKDGREGAKAIVEGGGTMLVQDEESATVYGMPKQVKQALPDTREFSLLDLPHILAQLT